MSSKEQPSPVEQLERCTVRITTDDGRSGTGFFFFESTANKPDVHQGYFIVVTSRHVIDGAQRIQLVLSVFDPEGILRHVTVDEPVSYFEPQSHPDPDIDLACLNISRLMNTFAHDRIRFDMVPLQRDVIPDDDTLSSFGPATDVIMIGYPNGHWDDVNNRPVFRRGITATGPSIPWQGRREFLIDMAVYEGSSGSPVLIYNNGAFTTKDGIQFGTRLYLLGINQGVYEVERSGQITIKSGGVDLAADADIRVDIPMNLGVCVSSKAVIELIEHVKRPRSVAFTGPSAHNVSVNFKLPDGSAKNVSTYTISGAGISSSPPSFSSPKASS